MSIISLLDRDLLRKEFGSAQPFPFMVLDDFLNDAFATAAAASFKPFEEATLLGRTFRKVNESRKVQIVDPSKFPLSIAKVAEALSSPEFLRDLEFITGISGLTWDSGYAGGGMHQTAQSGWLDVHVDFNFNRTLQLHRRLNLLLYLNPTWEESWGGTLELWNKDVSVCHHKILPLFNRCVIFATSSASYHGVSAVRCPEGTQRKSFAAYYYTKEAPDHWDGDMHSTIFKARPDEFMKRHVYMSAESASRKVASALRRFRGWCARN